MIVTHGSLVQNTYWNNYYWLFQIIKPHCLSWPQMLFYCILSLHVNSPSRICTVIEYCCFIIHAYNISERRKWIGYNIIHPFGTEKKFPLGLTAVVVWMPLNHDRRFMMIVNIKAEKALITSSFLYRLSYHVAFHYMILKNYFSVVVWKYRVYIFEKISYFH